MPKMSENIYENVTEMATGKNSVLSVDEEFFGEGWFFFGLFLTGFFSSFFLEIFLWKIRLTLENPSLKRVEGKRK